MMRGLALSAVLALCASVQSGAAEAPSTAAGPTVRVNASRTPANPEYVDAAKSRILNGKSASSCAFMDTPYDPDAPADGYEKYFYGRYDLYQQYMSDFALDNDLSNTGTRATIHAPTGDASTMPDASGLGTVAVDKTTGMPLNPLVENTHCGLGDWRMAASRQRIALHDKSLGVAYEAFDHEDYPRALALFTDAWNKLGYEEPALMLARQHLYGLGTPKDAPKAMYWLDQVVNGRYDPDQDQVRFDPQHPAAMTPKAEAAFMLARIHERGIGVPADRLKARRWYGKAAYLGFLPAQDILGQSLLADRGGDGNPARGIALLKAAGEAGYLPAAYHLGVAYHEGTGVARDDRQAAAWFGAAAKAGHAAAMFAMGRLLDLGEGVPADPAKALVFYKDAAVRGDRDAQFALGTYFYDGDLVAKDAATARKWFEAAARQGQADAMFNLGAMLAAGEGGTRDPALAYVWLSLAGEAGHDRAADAVHTLAPRLTPADRTRADAILRPVAAR